MFDVLHSKGTLGFFWAGGRGLIAQESECQLNMKMDNIYMLPKHNFQKTQWFVCVPGIVVVKVVAQLP